jgi:hypothetical protein
LAARGVGALAIELDDKALVVPEQVHAGGAATALAQLHLAPGTGRPASAMRRRASCSSQLSPSARPSV